MPAASWVDGMVVAGHGVASGRATNSPYPHGTIRLQQPFFLEAGVDLSQYFSGTLNVDVAPFLASELAHHVAQQRHIVFDGRLRWFGEIEERFVLSQVEVRVGAVEYEGLWYYPDPATKPDHRQRDTVVELLLPLIAGLANGDRLAIRF